MNMLYPSAEGLGDDFAFPDEFIQDFLPAYDLQNLGGYADLGLDEYFPGGVANPEIASNNQDYGKSQGLFGPNQVVLKVAQGRSIWQTLRSNRHRCR